MLFDGVFLFSFSFLLKLERSKTGITVPEGGTNTSLSVLHYDN